MQRVGCLVAALTLLVAAGSSRAGSIYSVDVNDEKLVTIDTGTGDVNVIGDLGFNALDVDLVSVGSRLFLLNSNYLTRVDLHEINTQTGASMSSVQLDSSVINAEGLAQVGGQLKIGYTTSGPASSVFGDLALDGTISNTTATSPEFDFDAFGNDVGGTQLYAMDHLSPSSTELFTTVSESPLTISMLLTHFDFADAVLGNDLVVDGNSLFLIDHGNPQFHTVDLQTFSFSSTSLSRDGQYFGAAHANVPEPSSVALWTIGAVLCGFQMRRRHLHRG